MNKITFKCQGSEDITIFAAAGEALLEVAVNSGIAIDAPCAGNGLCGKCKVKLISGELQSEKSRHITDEEWNDGIRLACQSKIVSDVVVEVPESAFAYRKGIRTADLSTDGELKIFEDVKKSVYNAGVKFTNKFRIVTLEMGVPDLSDTLPDNERVSRAVKAACGVQKVVLPHSLVKELPDILRDAEFKLDATVKIDADEAVVYALHPTGSTKQIYALAVDIGTTTVSALITDLLTGDIKAKSSCGNAQIRFGADVIHRIVKQCEAGGVKRMQKAVVDETLNPLISTMCVSLGITSNDIVEACVAGNTTMEHFFLGVNADFLRQEPFVPAFFKIDDIKASDVSLMINPAANIIMAPNVGSYVGGDITSGALASMLWDSEETELFIDLGTNGEIVLGNDDFMMSCACSAGPAFEGGDISCGMRATDGAVEAIRIDADTLEPTLSIIGDVKPIGLCGSGIIDIIGELFSVGAIDGKGKFIRENARIERDKYDIGRYIFATAEESGTGSAIELTEVDIDNFIRAKGALFSAVKMLCSMIELPIDCVSKIKIAGGIGSGIDIDNAVKIGMLPDVDKERYSYIGNSSLTGAYCMLISDDARAIVDNLSSNMTYIELSNENKYMEEFVAACFLPHTDSTLFTSKE